MEKFQKPIVLKNGATLLSHHVKEDEKSIEVSLKFDKPIQKQDLVELRSLGLSEVLMKPLQRKGWVTDGGNPTNLVPHQLSIGFEDNGKTWIFRFHTPDAAPKGQMVN